MTEILVVDDEPVIARAVSGGLRSLGYGVSSVDTAGAVFQVVRQRAPDCVLMDIYLTGQVDGIEVARRLNDEYGMPVIYLTGHADEETLLRALKTHPAGFLVKPVTIEAIRAAVEVALHDRVAARRPEVAVHAPDARLALVGALASGLAHEINNPLTYVSANVVYVSRQLAALERALMEGTTLEAARDEWRSGREELFGAVEDIKQGALRVRDIVNDFRAFANADPTTTVDVDVSAVIAHALRLMHDHLKHVGRVDVDTTPGCLVKGNEAQLEHVIVCTLMEAVGALRANVPGEGELRVRCRTQDGSVVIEVRDVRGVPEATHDHVSHRPGKAIHGARCFCADRVRAIGGSTQVQATDRGCTVTITLPALDAVAPPTPVRGRILVIDDDEMVARTLQRTLRDEHDVTVATGGKEGLGLLLAPGAAFDVVFCDLSMPEMSGPECFEELRKQRPDLAARLVFLTGGAHTSDTQAFLRSVPNERLEKPFDPERLKERARAGVKARGD